MADQPPRELIRSMAEHMQLKVTDNELPILEQAVQANEEFLVVVDGGDRTFREDPLDFMRFVRTWRKLDDN